MRVLAFLLVLALVPFSGCASSDEGRFVLHVTDAPGNIDDFSSLNVTVESITMTSKDDAKVNLTPSDATFDLTKLLEGNTTTLFAGDVPVGNYTRLDIHFRDAKGVLKSDGSVVDVKAPSGRVFLNTGFEIASGKETTFLFDIQVHMTGNGEYQFKPNADGSGPGKVAKK